MKIATWNINSIRARLGCLERFSIEYKPDVLMLQEIKTRQETFPAEVVSDLGYNHIIKGQKSYNGVAILSRYPIEIISDSLLPNDEQARYIEALIQNKDKTIRCASVYVPNGASNEPLETSKKFAYKLEFLDALEKKLIEYKDNEEIVLFGGDYNIAHNEIDLFNPQDSAGDVSFTDQERNKFQSFLDAGYVDIFRHKFPKLQEYSWWDYRASSFVTDKGWRIDHILMPEQQVQSVLDCEICRDTRGWEKPSDHAPFMITL